MDWRAAREAISRVARQTSRKSERRRMRRAAVEALTGADAAVSARNVREGTVAWEAQRAMWSETAIEP